MSAFVSRRSLHFLAIAALVFATSSEAHAQSRTPATALLIGNSYGVGFAPALRNTKPDARLIAKSLSDIGVRTLLLQDIDHADLSSALQNFINGIRRNEVAIFYFAGHGMQIDGQNYMLMQDGETLAHAAPMIEAIRARATATIAILDACRDNPFAGAGTDAQGRSITLAGASRSAPQLSSTSIKEASAGRGLARMEMRGAGVRLVFSTETGNVALDGDASESNGPFAKALAARLSEKVGFDEVIANVTRDVRAATNNQQSPWQQGSLEETIYLAGPPPRGAPAPFGVPG